MSECQKNGLFLKKEKNSRLMKTVKKKTVPKLRPPLPLPPTFEIYILDLPKNFFIMFLKIFLGATALKEF